MKLKINGEVKEFTAASLTVVALLEQLDLHRRPVAVELNKQLIFKRNHASTELHDGDQLEIVTMVGGG